MHSPSGLSWARMRSLGPCGPPVPCLPLTTLERNIPYDCSVSGELPRALLVRAGRGGEKPQGVGIQGNNLTCAAIAFIARAWRLHSFTSQVYQLQDGWWLLNLWESSCSSEPWVLGIRVLLIVQCPVACSERLLSKLMEACLSGALDWGPWLSQEVGAWAAVFPAGFPSAQKPNHFTITGSHSVSDLQPLPRLVSWGDWNWDWDCAP